MNLPANVDNNARVDNAPSDVTLQFRRDQKHSGISRHGQLHPGKVVKIEYDPARLISALGTTVNDVVCHLRFRPSGEQRSGSLVPEVRSWRNPTRPSGPLAFQAQIPSGASAVEIWFEGRGSIGTAGWDSQYGRNYVFPMAEAGLAIPERSVVLRPEAVVDPNRIRVVEDAASKEQITMGASGTRLQTGLVVRARLDKPAASTLVWADIHVFDATGDLLHTGTISLDQAEPPTADTELRFWDAEVYSGSGGASGMGVWARPDAHTIQYRLYCQIEHDVFTNGVLHQFDVPADREVKPIPGGW